MQVWDEDAAQIAQDYAEMCKMEKNDELNPLETGENFAYGPSVTINNQLDMWSNEGESYDITAEDPCSADTCEHYTQVWSDL